MPRTAPWISLEGVDGAGKSSHVNDIVAHLRAAGFEVVSTHQPGGVPGWGKDLRAVLLNNSMTALAAALLAFGDRAEHLHQVIRPSLAAGSAVVCDRFTDSTYAYQGAGDGDEETRATIALLEQRVHPSEKPDLTLVFDLPVEESMRRLARTGKTPDNFESKSPDFFQRVRSCYHARAAAEPNRIVLIDSRPALDDVRAAVADVVREFLVRWAARPEAGATGAEAVDVPPVSPPSVTALPRPRR